MFLDVFLLPKEEARQANEVLLMFPLNTNDLHRFASFRVVGLFSFEFSQFNVILGILISWLFSFYWLLFCLLDLNRTFQLFFFRRFFPFRSFWPSFKDPVNFLFYELFMGLFFRSRVLIALIPVSNLRPLFLRIIACNPKPRFRIRRVGRLESVKVIFAFNIEMKSEVFNINT